MSSVLAPLPFLLYRIADYKVPISGSIRPTPLHAVLSGISLKLKLNGNELKILTKRNLPKCLPTLKVIVIVMVVTLVNVSLTLTKRTLHRKIECHMEDLGFQVSIEPFLAAITDVKRRRFMTAAIRSKSTQCFLSL
uniref:Uncharacterized protein n=1 Tax=Glossina pallidipes TaxID=7398 RepID=A0A1B0AGP2_GLOPL